MEALRKRIEEEAIIYDEDMINVDSFLNHQVDAVLMGQMAEEFARRFDLTGVTKILTAEASGIPLAAVCAYKFGIPLVYARKLNSEPPAFPVYKSTVFSFTLQRPTTYYCDARFLSQEDTVLIIDDFLAGGQSMRGLVSIVRQAGAGIRGIGVAVEKLFEGGSVRLRADGLQVEALAPVQRIEKGKIIFG